MDLTNYIQGALLGACIGDTHAFRLHWYYSYDIMREHVLQFYCTGNEDYMTDFHAVHPSAKHPDSFKYFSKYDPKKVEHEDFKDEFRIFHHSSELWKKEGQPYHLTLRQGENTITVQLAMILMEELTESLKSKDQSVSYYNESLYPKSRYLERYFDFFTKENQHNDFYIEEIHREFFANYAKGKPLDECGKEDETCLSGLTLMLPLVFVFGQNVVKAVSEEERHNAMHLLKDIVCQHSILTHRSNQMAELVFHIAELLVNIMLIKEDTFVGRKAKARYYVQEAFDKINLGDPIDLKDIVNLSEEDVFIGKNCAKKFSVR